MSALLSPADVIETLAESYYQKLHEGEASQAWAALPDCRRERHRRAVRALLLRHCEVMEQQRQAERATQPPKTARTHAPLSHVREDLARIGTSPDEGGVRRFTERVKAKRAG